MSQAPLSLAGHERAVRVAAATLCCSPQTLPPLTVTPLTHAPQAPPPLAVRERAVRVAAAIRALAALHLQVYPATILDAYKVGALRLCF